MTTAPKPRRGAPLPAAEIRAAAEVPPGQPRPTLAALAAQFKCSMSQVSRILRGDSWPGVGGPIGAARPRGKAVLGRRVQVRLPLELEAAVDRARGRQSARDWLVEAAASRLRVEAELGRTMTVMQPVVDAINEGMAHTGNKRTI